MFARISNSWALIKASAAVLRADKELIVFPIVSAIGVLVVTASFAFPMFLADFFDSLLAGRSQAFGLVVGFVFYLVQYFVIIFANSALVGAAMIRLRGGDPTVKDGFRIAFSRFMPIVGWALVSATVGLVLNMLSGKGNKKGSGISTMISKLLGAAWNVVTFLVVPVLAIEGLGPLKAVQRSWNLLKRSWGEQIAGTISIGIVFTLVGILGGLLLVGLGVGLTVALESAIPAIVCGILLFIFIITLSLINATLSGIFAAAVYGYAAEGQVGLIDESLIRSVVMTEGGGS